MRRRRQRHREREFNTAANTNFLAAGCHRPVDLFPTGRPVRCSRSDCDVYGSGLGYGSADLPVAEERYGRIRRDLRELHDASGRCD